MTIHRMTSYREAIDRSRSNPLATWPERENSARLEPIASPSFESGVKLKPGAKVVTMGSCFARNIEEYFQAEGFDVPLMDYSAPLEEYGQGGRIQGILNKYTLASIAIEIDWLARVKAEGGVVTWDNVQHMFLELDNGKFVDLQLSSGVPVSWERAIERRQQIYDIHSQIFDCDLAVLTPGLTETWFDTKTGYHIQRIPGPRQARLDPDRFTFEVMDFFQCYELLDRAIRTLKANGTSQIALTVSPVPLNRTMTDQDVLVANTYSKSTLRAVVGVICERHDRVFYVPSYERVMLSKDTSIWRPDLRHVADEFVGTIASNFAAAALGRSAEGMNQVVAFETAVQEGRLDDAKAALDSLGPKALELTLQSVIKAAAQLHMTLGRWEDALPFARRLIELKPHTIVGYRLEYRIHLKRGDHAAARGAMEKAILNCKDVTEKDFAVNGAKAGKEAA